MAPRAEAVTPPRDRDPVQGPEPLMGAPPYVAAIRAGQDASGGAASGLLVDQRHVLTSARALARLGRRPGSDTAPQDLEVLTGLSASNSTLWRRARPLAEDAANDLALLCLDRPVYGVEPPRISADRISGASRLAFGYRAGRFDRSEFASASQTLHYAEGAAAPQAINHDHALPPGFAGGPRIAVVGSGRHWLDGICTLDGLAGPVGLVAGVGPILAFLERAIRWRDTETELSWSVRPPGIAAGFTVTAEGVGDLRLSFARESFRLARPLSATARRRLLGEDDRIGGEALPAHLPEAEAATDCLERLSKALGLALRLPTVAELKALVEADVPPPVLPDTGNLPTLALYEANPNQLAPPTGTAEWASEGGISRVLLRRSETEPLVPLAGGAWLQPRQPHLRFVLRPLCRPD